MTHAPTRMPAAAQMAPVFVDATHLGRTVTGIERITLELFSETALAPLPVRFIRPPLPGLAGLVAGQYVSLPATLARHGRAIALCPGFPPSLILSRFAERVIPYIHDLFLITRRADLSARARLYMAPAFARALRALPRFFVNSRTTARELARFARPDARIHLYRPRVRNVFDLSDEGRDVRPAPGKALQLVALGTIEPRKNLLAAANIVFALRQRGYPEATLHIIGRSGWGGVEKKLQGRSGVILHGYQPKEVIARMLHEADAFITTSHDEGLGLPLLEAQYAGLPVIAPFAPVFREVLGDSGIFIDAADPSLAAQKIITILTQDGAQAAFAAAARANIGRWNHAADADHAAIVALLMQLASGREA